MMPKEPLDDGSLSPFRDPIKARPLPGKPPKWCLAMHNPGDTFASLGLANRVREHFGLEKMNIVYLGWCKELPQIIAAQPWVGEVTAIAMPSNPYGVLKQACVIESMEWLRPYVEPLGIDVADVAATQVDFRCSRWQEAAVARPPRIHLPAAFPPPTRGPLTFSLHPRSEKSDKWERHWPHWKEAIDWLLDTTNYLYYLTGHGYDGESFGTHLRLVNLVGHTSLAEALSLTYNCDGYIGTCNSFAGFALSTGTPGVSCYNKALDHGFDTFFGAYLDYGNLQGLRWAEPLESFQRAFQATERRLLGRPDPRKAVLVQCASSNQRCLLDLTEPRHRALCAKYGIEYYRWDAPFAMSPYWNKWPVIRSRLSEHDLVIYLYADTLWERDVDLRQALRWGEIGMCANYGGPHQVERHFNAGAIWMRGSMAVQRLADEWRREPDEGHSWGDQYSLNKVLKRRGYQGLEVLDDQWNSSPCNPVERPVVHAWHGAGDVVFRRDRMEEALRECNPVRF